KNTRTEIKEISNAAAAPMTWEFRGFLAFGAVMVAVMLGWACRAAPAAAAPMTWEFPGFLAESKKYQTCGRRPSVRRPGGVVGPAGPGANSRSARDGHSLLGPPRALRVLAPRERSLLGCASLGSRRCGV